MPIAIVTDSAASLPPNLREQHDITVVPMCITVDDESYQDGELSQERIVELVEGGADVTTSTPSPGMFVQAIEERANDDGVLVLTVSSTMSGTHDAAKVAAGMAGCPVEVVDTLTAAGAQGIVVLEAARRAARGATLDEVVGHARQVADEVHLVATVGTLDFLVRSGRVPGIAGKAGDALGAKPLFAFRQGKPSPLRPAFGRDSSLGRVVGAWEQDAQDAQGRLHVAALHSLAADDARWLLDQVLQQADDVAESFVAEFSAMMTVHTGPGLAGLAWWWEQR